MALEQFAHFMRVQRLQISAVSQLHRARPVRGERIGPPVLLWYWPWMPDVQDTTTRLSQLALTQTTQGGVLAIREVGRVGDGAYVATAAVEGVGLDVLAGRLEQSSPKVALALCAELCAVWGALMLTPGQTVCRELWPADVFVDVYGALHVVPWALDAVRAGALVSRAAFVAPELHAEKRCPATAVWQVAHLVRQVCPNVSGPVLELLKKASAPDPMERHMDLGVFAQAIRDVSEGLGLDAATCQAALCDAVGDAPPRVPAAAIQPLIDGSRLLDARVCFPVPVVSTADATSRAPVANAPSAASERTMVGPPPIAVQDSAPQGHASAAVGPGIRSVALLDELSAAGPGETDTVVNVPRSAAESSDGVDAQSARSIGDARPVPAAEPEDEVAALGSVLDAKARLETASMAGDLDFFTDSKLGVAPVGSGTTDAPPVMDAQPVVVRSLLDIDARREELEARPEATQRLSTMPRVARARFGPDGAGRPGPSRTIGLDGGARIGADADDVPTGEGEAIDGQNEPSGHLHLGASVADADDVPTGEGADVPDEPEGSGAVRRVFDADGRSLASGDDLPTGEGEPVPAAGTPAPPAAPDPNATMIVSLDDVRQSAARASVDDAALIAAPASAARSPEATMILDLPQKSSAPREERTMILEAGAQPRSALSAREERTMVLPAGGLVSIASSEPEDATHTEAAGASASSTGVSAPADVAGNEPSADARSERGRHARMSAEGPGLVSTPGQTAVARSDSMQSVAPLGDDSRLEYDDDAPGVLVIEAPERAEVFVDGRVAGHGRIVLEDVDRFRTFSVRIHCPGFAPWSAAVSLDGQSAARVDPDLARRV